MFYVKKNLKMILKTLSKTESCLQKNIHYFIQGKEIFLVNSKDINVFIV